jgi:predicted Fe-Mo cluster-binding NifX family protein
MASEIEQNPALDCVAICLADGADLTADVGERFGRARRFLLVRGGAEGTVEAVDNPSCEVAQGAGPAAASFLQRRGVTTVLAGQFGPKAEQVLRAGGITPVCVAPGTVASEALKRLQNEASGVS